MSTKDISRSALEGGRYNYNKYERNESHVHERSRAKVWLDRVRVNDEAAEGSDPQPRNKVYKGFTDKLNPCYAWLASHAGQPWDKVHSKLRQTFDTRLLSAWHIVAQHMLPEVEGAGTTSDALAHYRSQRFFIDDQGILRDRGKNYRKSRPRAKWEGPSKEEVAAVMQGRKVFTSYYSDGLYWGHPGKGEWVVCSRKNCPLRNAKHRTYETTSASLAKLYDEPSHRSFRDSTHWRTFQTDHFVPNWTMGKELTKKEAAWWETISYAVRSEFEVRRRY